MEMSFLHDDQIRIQIPTAVIQAANIKFPCADLGFGFRLTMSSMTRRENEIKVVQQNEMKAYGRIEGQRKVLQAREPEKRGLYQIVNPVRVL